MKGNFLGETLGSFLGEGLGNFLGETLGSFLGEILSSFLGEGKLHWKPFLEAILAWLMARK